jgi:hypothetical protein
MYACPSNWRLLQQLSTLQYLLLLLLLPLHAGLQQV